MRIYFVGSHCVGKTKMVRETAKRYGLPTLSEAARQVLAQWEPLGGLKALAGDLQMVTDYQEEVFRQQVKIDFATGDSFVADRAFDNLVYAARWARAGTVSRLMAEEGARYVERVRGGRVFFVRPHRELLAEDGIRAHISWEDVVLADGGVLFALEVLGIPYVPIPCREFSDRMRIVEAVLGPPPGGT